ncbi:MAG: ferritin-like domain-containing protein [Chloroflexi bacterium]|nr:ferritin-like domain-containing protein [Chloroflexota bacterium]
MQNLQELYVHQLRDLYSAETQLVDALPKMAEAASTDDLKQAFEHHLEQTRGHVKRIEEIFDAMGESPQGETCEGMQGLIKEGQKVMKKDGDQMAKDAALIAAAQRVEHYEIAAYGTVCTYAEQLSENDAHQKLTQTLDEEKNTDSKLTDLAVNRINQKAKS